MHNKTKGHPEVMEDTGFIVQCKGYIQVSETWSNECFSYRNQEELIAECLHHETLSSFLQTGECFCAPLFSLPISEGSLES
jgi:hypothetical protein